MRNKKTTKSWKILAAAKDSVTAATTKGNIIFFLLPMYYFIYDFFCFGLNNFHFPSDLTTKSEKKIVQRCIRCVRIKPSSTAQLMGDLSEDWVSLNRPFFNVGSTILDQYTYTKGYVAKNSRRPMSPYSFVSPLKHFISRWSVTSLQMRFWPLFNASLDRKDFRKNLYR